MEFIRIHDGSLQTHTKLLSAAITSITSYAQAYKDDRKMSNINITSGRIQSNCTCSQPQQCTMSQQEFVYLPLFTCLCLPAFVCLCLPAFVYLPFLPAMCVYMQWRCVHAKMLGEATIHVGVHPLNSGYIIMVFLTTLEIIYSNVLRNVVTLNSCDLMDKF